jgi:hypothetical protein
MLSSTVAGSVLDLNSNNLSKDDNIVLKPSLVSAGSLTACQERNRLILKNQVIKVTSLSPLITTRLHVSSKIKILTPVGERFFKLQYKM